MKKEKKTGHVRTYKSSKYRVEIDFNYKVDQFREACSFIRLIL